MKSAEAAVADELTALETGALDPRAFPHPEHVRLAYEMLERYPFGEAITRFSRGLKLLAAKAGRPEVYHETITVAFLAVIGERRAREACKDWPEFKANQPRSVRRALPGKMGIAPSSSLPTALVCRSGAANERRFCRFSAAPSDLFERGSLRHRFSPASRETRRRAAGQRSRAAPG